MSGHYFKPIIELIQTGIRTWIFDLPLAILQLVKLTVQ